MVRPRRAAPRRRLVALLVVMALAFVGIATRLVFVQGVSAQRYATFGQSQRLRTIALPAHRGSILDRAGAELAISIRQRTVWADPRLIRDPAGDARTLAPLLHLDASEIEQRLTTSGAFVYLARKVDDATAEAVKALKLPGVSLLDEPKRFDPAGALGLPLLGQVGTDNEGLSGLELQYERELRGRPGELLVERDQRGHRIPAGIHRLQPSRPGEDLILSIDRSMQYETERSLAAEIVSSNSKGGTAIVMDPTTGEILAMANLVSRPDGVGPAATNIGLTSVYEPGSVNKVITIAGALEEGLVTPAAQLVVPDHITVADAEFSDHEPHPTVPWSVTDIVANSSNVGTIMIGRKLGKAGLDKYLRDFGLGRRSGLRFPGEAAGLLMDPSKWSGTSNATFSIGQGVAVTALQMLGAYNTIANGGVQVAPKLVKGVRDRSGRMHETPPSERRTVVSLATAQAMTGMLGEVVRVGTGKAAAVEGYSVAGKTGTARKPLEGARGYRNGAYVATFAGFVPAQAPRLSAIVVLDEPTPIYGGLVSAPVFSEVARYGLRLFKVPPAAPLTSGSSTVGAVPEASPEAAGADHEAPGSTGGARPGVSRPEPPPTTLGAPRTRP